MAANSPTTPHERIRSLTSSDDPRSPFFDIKGGPIVPVAKIVIRRLSISVSFRNSVIFFFVYDHFEV